MNIHEMCSFLGKRSVSFYKLACWNESCCCCFRTNHMCISCISTEEPLPYHSRMQTTDVEKYHAIPYANFNGVDAYLIHYNDVLQTFECLLGSNCMVGDVWKSIDPQEYSADFLASVAYLQPFLWTPKERVYCAKLNFNEPPQQILIALLDFLSNEVVNKAEKAVEILCNMKTPISI